MSKQPNKRPSILGDLGIADLAPASETIVTEGGADNVVSMPAAQAKVRSNIVKTTIYLPPAVHQKLREIAFTTDCKVHDLIMEGVSSVLTRHGHPNIEQLKRV